VGGVLPVAEGGELAVGAALAGVLGAGLPVHLEHRAPGLADHPADEVEVVHLYRRRRRLIRLIHALEDGRDETRRAPHDRGGFPQRALAHAGDAGHALRGPFLDHVAERLEAHRVLGDEALIDVPGIDDQVEEPVQQGDIGAEARRQMHVRLRGGDRPAWIHHDQAGRVVAAAPVQNARPQHGLGLGHVVADLEDGVRGIEIGERAWRPVRPEGFHERGGGRRRTQPSIPVHVVRADADLGDDGKGVVLLQAELPRVVEGKRARPVSLLDLSAALDDDVERLAPRGRLQPPIAAYQRPGQAVATVIGLPPV